LHDGGNDFANDRRDDLSDDGGRHEPDNVGGENDDRDAEEREGKRSGGDPGT